MSENRMYYSREAEMQAARQRTVTILVCLMGGLGIGTVLALMFAPNSGEKSRADLGRAIEEGVKTSRDNVEPALKRMEKEMSDLRGMVDERIKDHR